MTREEAKRSVEAAFMAWESEYQTGDDWSEEHEARDMAIKALDMCDKIAKIINSYDADFTIANYVRGLFNV